jgi:hypothetical protein
MVNIEDLESFIIRMDLEYNELDEGMYLIRHPEGAPIVVHYSPPVLLLRMKVADLAESAESIDLFRQLLVWNASDVVHGAYGLEEGELILSDTLELETLDFHELRASIESIQLAMSGHLETIRTLAGLDEHTSEADAAVAGEVEG